MKSADFRTGTGPLILLLLAAVLAWAMPEEAVSADERPDIFVQMGHSGKVNAVAFSPDGRYALSGGEDYVLKLWEVSSGMEIRTFRGHRNWVTSVAFSPDGKYALSGSRDNTLRLWDMASGAPLRTFRADWITFAAFSPDGRHALAGSVNGTLTRWDIATGAEIGKIQGYSRDVVALSPDHRSVLSIGLSNTLTLRDAYSGREMKVFTGHSDEVRSAAFSPDGRYILSGSIDKTMRLWDASSGRQIRVFRGHSDWVQTVAFSPDGRQLLSGSFDNTLKLWDADGNVLRTFKGHSFRVHSAVFSPDGRQILSGGADFAVLLWDAADGRRLQVFIGFAREAACTAFSPDGSLALSGGPDRTLKLWDLAGGVEIRKFTGHSGPVTATTFSPDGRLALSGSEDTTIRLWDVKTGREIRVFKGHSKGINSVLFSPDGKQRALSTGLDDTQRLWDVQSGREIRTFKVKTGSMAVQAFSPDGRFAVSAGEDYVLKLRDLASGGEPVIMKGHSDFVHAVAFSPDGRQILSGGGGLDRTLRLWDAKSGKEIRTFRGHTDWVTSVAFSPDGRQVLSGSEDTTLKLWDAVTGSEIRTFRGHTGNVNSVAFHPDGRHVLSASGVGIRPISYHGSGGDSTIRLWDVSNGREIAQFISLMDDDWVVITPEGPFKGSRYGPAFLNVRQGNRVFGLEQFYDVFYRPDIVEAKLKGEDTAALDATNIEEALRNPPPQVAFQSVPKETAETKVTIGYRITAAGGGIGEVRLFHNGKLIQSDGFYRQAKAAPAGNATLLSYNARAIREDLRSINLVARQESGLGLMRTVPKGDVYEGSITVDAIPGENDVSLAAFNRSNSVQSILKTATFRSTLKADDPRMYILAVGIDEFKSRESNLRFAVKDAESFARRIQEQSRTQYRRENIHISSLINGDATKRNIQDRIHELSRTVKPGDVFVLFMASHGVIQSGLYSIVTHDYNGTLDSGSLLSSNEIMEISKNIKSLTQIYILDTCHAGGLDRFVSGLYDARMTVMARNMGLHMFASASSTQAALDGYRGRNGVFTYSLLEGLDNNRAADADGDSRVSIRELGAYARERTARYSKESGHTQTPVINHFGKDISVYVVRRQ